MSTRAAIVGVGSSTPAGVRFNDDPLFDHARREGGDEVSFFGGSKRRTVLGRGESIEEHMVAACRVALADAAIDPARVDRLYGASFVSRFLSPNGLYRVHRDLGLPRSTLVVPVCSEFSNFATSVVLASEAIAAGRASYVLVACGASLTRHMDYRRGHAVPIGDGAGAALVAASPGGFEVVDWCTETRSDLFDEMAMSIRTVQRDGVATMPTDEDGVPVPVYDMSLGTVRSMGIEVPPVLVRSLLARHALEPGEVALIPHQATRTLIDAWRAALRPAELFDTFDELGNASLASVPITLARHRADVRSEHVVLLSAGTGNHFTALLLRRCA